VLEIIQERGMSLDLPKIGQLLREAREFKGLRLEDVSDALYLRKSIIDALESGNWDKLPHQVYVKGYLNQYALYLNMEGELAEATRTLTESEELPDAAPGKAKNSLPTKDHFNGIPGNTYPKGRLVMYGAGVAVLVAFLVYQNINRSYSPPAPAGMYAVSNTVYETAAQPSEHPSAAVLELKKLVIACQERTWIRIVIDETEKKEFMLNPEEMVAFNAKKGFDLLIGNAGGVTLFYNGANIGLGGENGEVKRVRLP
jgi:cytoskeleton protein RodZ